MDRQGYGFMLTSYPNLGRVSF